MLAPSHSGWPDQIASAIPLTFFDTVGINPYSAFKQGSYRTDPRISSMRNRQSLTQGTLVRRFNNHQRAPSRTSVQDLSDANIKIAEMSSKSVVFFSGSQSSYFVCRIFITGVLASAGRIRSAPTAPQVLLFQPFDFFYCNGTKTIKQAISIFIKKRCSL